MRTPSWVGRLQFAGCVIGLTALAAVLPAPGTWPSQLTGLHAVTGERVAAAAVAEQAVLLAASVLVWLLLLWSIAVAGALTAAGLPGLPGRCGRILLRRIAPAAASRLLAAAVGVSLIAGTSACAAPWAAGISQPGGSTETSSLAANGTTTDTPPAPSITIDWPDTFDNATNLAREATPLPALTPETTPSTPLAATPPSTTSVSPAPEETTPQPTAAAPTSAADQAAPAPIDSPPTGTALTGTLPIGTAPTGTAPPDTAPTGAGRVTVTVRPGDSLWSIASAAMQAPATPADIDAAWRAWYATNEAVIGSDPNLIEPGQLLLPPTPSTESGR